MFSPCAVTPTQRCRTQRFTCSSKPINPKPRETWLSPSCFRPLVHADSGSLIFERNMSCHWLCIDDAPYVIRPTAVGTFDLDVTFPFHQVRRHFAFNLFASRTEGRREEGGRKGGERWGQRL